MDSGRSIMDSGRFVFLQRNSTCRRIRKHPIKALMAMKNEVDAVEFVASFIVKNDAAYFVYTAPYDICISHLSDRRKERIKKIFDSLLKLRYCYSPCKEVYDVLFDK
ncbi:hypothetical protein [Alphabaculovirus myunipunctae]|uniref:Uncharacterized protein n=1 Tax=Mythimna unipuncta nucleopolyhedrovirus TaxID=447897 RepID=A0A2K9VS55_9ABAC|nr:hypothetical protein [Mythimna unipuncta nucleopolyhedrovirus]AUV65280.1 hypothetical protein [Mythimna unipuncta nucleopolyhedrovirus]